MTNHHQANHRLIALDTVPCPECKQEAVLMQLLLKPNLIDPSRAQPLAAHKLCFNCLWHGHFTAGPNGTWTLDEVEKTARDGD